MDGEGTVVDFIDVFDNVLFILVVKFFCVVVLKFGVWVIVEIVVIFFVFVKFIENNNL